MPATKSDIIAQLQKEILPLQGLKRVATDMEVDLGLGPINHAFPNSSFPLAAIHEFCCNLPEEAAATAGFITGLLSAFMQNGRAILWISSSRILFPPALACFGVIPDNIIFIDLQKEKEVLWAMEEALKCDALAAVVGEVHELAFTASRRLQLTVEHSRVTGFVLRRSPGKLNTTASVTRWKISPLPGEITGDMPGVGFPRWKVELMKVRNGKPGSWEIGWRNGCFRHVFPLASIITEQHRKTG
jgi:protein ImuA